MMTAALTVLAIMLGGAAMIAAMRYRSKNLFAGQGIAVWTVLMALLALLLHGKGQ